jgi:ABC-type nickel/cobalt efflux system permease component RcnA
MIVTFAISTISSAVVAGLIAGTLGGIAVVALIFLLIVKELSSAEVESGRASKRLEVLSRYVVIPIVPLLLVFAVIVAVKVWEVL